jgi:hypothetical protein
MFAETRHGGSRAERWAWRRPRSRTAAGPRTMPVGQSGPAAQAEETPCLLARPALLLTPLCNCGPSAHRALRLCPPRDRTPKHQAVSPYRAGAPASSRTRPRPGVGRAGRGQRVRHRDDLSTIGPAAGHRADRAAATADLLITAAGGARALDWAYPPSFSTPRGPERPAARDIRATTDVRVRRSLRRSPLAVACPRVPCRAVGLVSAGGFGSLTAVGAPAVLAGILHVIGEAAAGRASTVPGVVPAAEAKR